MPVVSKSTELAAGLHNTAIQSKHGTQKSMEGNTSSLPNPNGSEFAKHAVNQIFGHSGTGNETRYRVWFDDHSAEENICKSAVMVPTNFIDDT